MKENIAKVKNKIRKKAIDDFVKYFGNRELNRREANDVKVKFDRYVESQVNNLYNQTKEMQSFEKTLSAGLASLRNSRYDDSKAEGILYAMLEEQNVSFRYQYQIGKYTVDFLIGESLVLELDGPHHKILGRASADRKRDSYIEHLGYNVFRLPIWMLSVDPELILNEIRKMILRRES